MPAEIWESQIRHFSSQYRVVAVDPRSQGESGKPTEGHYPERRARDYKELVEQLKLAPTVLVGWSLGVPEVLTYVQEFGTASLRGVVLVDGMIGSDPNPRWIAAVSGMLRNLQLDRTKFTEEFVRGMYRKPQPPEYLKRIIAASLKTSTNTAVTLMANLAVGDWRPVLSKLDKPVLFVGSAAMKEQAASLQAKLPSARTEIFPEAGHALFVDEAERFNQLLESFLQGNHPR
jgi:microsomal epoxide hydrolase